MSGISAVRVQPRTASVPGYEVRPARRDERDPIRGLLRSQIGETRVTRWTKAFWRWKHLECPFGPSTVFVATPDGSDDVVSVMHALRWRLSGLDGGEFSAARPCDGATLPVHRRRGLYTAIDLRTQERLQQEGVRLCLGTPNPKTLGMELKTGWRVVARVPQLVRPMYSVRALRSLVVRLRSNGEGGEASPVPEHPSGFMSWRAFRASYAGDIDNLVACHEKSRRSEGFRTPRSRVYLDWRYGAVPTVTYRVHPLVEGRALEGFGVLRGGETEDDPIVVDELFVRDAEPRLIDRLLESLLRHARTPYLLAAYARGSLEHRALRRKGFLARPGGRVVLSVRDLTERGQHGGTAHHRWDDSMSLLEVL